MKQLEATEPHLRAQIDRTRAAESQTRRPGLHCGAGAERLAFVMAGDATYQVRCRRWRRCPARPAVKPKPCRPISRGTRRCGTPLPMSHMELRRRPRRRRRLQRPLPTAPPGARQEGGRREGRRALHQGIREPRDSHGYVRPAAARATSLHARHPSADAAHAGLPATVFSAIYVRVLRPGGPSEIRVPCDRDTTGLTSVQGVLVPIAPNRCPLPRRGRRGPGLRR